MRLKQDDDTINDPTADPNPVPEPTPDPVPDPVPEPTPTPEPTPEPSDPGGGSGSEKVNPQVLDALTIGTTETIATAASNALANMYQHQINHIRRVDSLTEACLGKMMKRIASQDPTEAVAVSKLLKGESDSSIVSLLAQLSASQEAAKIAQSTSGDLATDIAKVSAAVASVQGLVGGLVGVLQQMLMNGTDGVQVNPINLMKKDKAPIPTPMPAPKPKEHEGEYSPPPKKFPIVTIRY